MRTNDKEIPIAASAGAQTLRLPPGVVAPGSAERVQIGPWWHTVGLIAIVFGLSALQVLQAPTLAQAHVKSVLLLYIPNLIFEFVLLGYVWLALRRYGVRLRDIVGGKWSSPKDVLHDIGIAVVFWFVVVTVLFGMTVLLHVGESITGAVQALLPQTPLDMVVWVLLSVTAGFCEEIIFRGYLQRQFFALTGKAEAAVVLQALVFGAGHVYEGGKRVIMIIVYGALFGLLAQLVKSLRPGILQHAAQDSLAGIAGSILQRHRPI